jgi:hypothetical protein
VTHGGKEALSIGTTQKAKLGRMTKSDKKPRTEEELRAEVHDQLLRSTWVRHVLKHS